MSKSTEKSYWVFEVNHLASEFLGTLLNSYSSLDELRDDYPKGIVVIAKGVHSDDNGKTVDDYRVIFSAAGLWKN